MRGTRTANLCQTEGGRGKPGYRAPELLRDEGSAFNKQVDLWALGCILYELCTGEKLFKSDLDGYDFALLRKSGGHDLLPLYPERPDEILGILLPLLEYDYRRRPTAIAVRKSITELYLKSGKGADAQSPGAGIHL
jgi:serine/threonine protein kinase